VGHGHRPRGTAREDQTTTATIPFGSFLPDIDPTIQTTTSAFRFEVGYRRVPTATGYFTEVDTDPGFSAPNTFSHADTAVVLSVTDLGTYYFRVRAENNMVSASEAKPCDPVAFVVVADLGGPTGDDAGSAMFLGTVNAATGQYSDFNIYPATDEDWFALDLTTDATLTVEVPSGSLPQPALEVASPEGTASPSDLNPYLAIFDPGLNLIASNAGDVTDLPISVDGTHYIRVTSSAQSSVGYYELVVTVNAPAVARVEVTPTTATIVPTGQVQLTGQTFDQFDVELFGREAIWSSSDNAIAAVDGTGLVTGQSIGTATITFESEGISNTATIDVTSISGALSLITASPTSITADGVATATITVQLRDASGNNLTTGGVVVTLVTDLGTLGAVTDNTDGTYTATLTSATTAGTATVTGTVNAIAIIDDATVTFTAGAAAPATSLITAVPTSIAADGVSTATITVQLKDASGNNLTTGGDAVTLVTDLGTLGAVSDNTDGTYTATLTSATTAGTATVTGTVNGLDITDDATVGFTAVPDPSTSQITAAPSIISADGSSTSTITVQLKDASDLNLTTGGDVVTLATDAGSLSAVTDNGDGTYTATLTASTTVGTATITGTVNTIPIADNATVAFTNRPLPSASTSTIGASPTSIRADNASTSAITVQLKDASGVNMSTGGDAVTLATTLGTLSAVTDNGDGTYSATLTAGLTAGTAAITGTVNGMSIPDDDAVTLTTGSASASTSTITASPTSIEADGSATSTITVQLKDDLTVDLIAGGDAVSLATDLGTLSGVTDNGDGTYTATLTAGLTAGTATITGTLNTVSMTNTATVTVTLLPDPATSTITASPTSIVADGTATSTITVQLKDVNSTNVTTGGDAVTLATTLGTLSAVTDNGNGTYTATLTAGLTAGTATITGTLNTVSMTNTATVTVTPLPADPATSTITASPTSIVADGAATSTVTVQLRDQNSTNLTTGGDAVTLATTLGTLSGVTDNGDGTYSATLTAGTTVGTATITGTVNTILIADNTTVTLTNPVGIRIAGVGANNGTKAADDMITNGDLSGTFVILSTTAYNAKTVAELRTEFDVLIFTSQSSSSTDADWTTRLLPYMALGGGIIFEDDGNPGDLAPGITATTGTSSGSALTVSRTVPGLTDGILDNTFTNSHMSFTAFDPALTDFLVSGSTVMGLFGRFGSGCIVATGVDLHEHSVKGSSGDDANGYNLLLNEVNYVAAGCPPPMVASAATSTISASPTSIPPDGVSTSAISVQLRDAGNNNLVFGGDAVALATTLGTLSAVTDNGNGTYTATLTAGTTPGTATITGTVNSASIVDDATVTLRPTPSAATSAITASPPSIPADGSSTSVITVQLRDQASTNWTTGGDAVTLATTLGTLSAVTDNADGTYTATLTAGTASGAARITGTLNAVAITDDATVLLTAGAASAGNSTISALPILLGADGSSTSLITVQLKDTNDNELTTGGDAVTLATTLGTLSTVTDNADGTYTATLTAGTTAGTATITGTVNGTPIGDDATVTLSAASAATSTITASPSLIASDGAATSTITVQLKDATSANLTSGGDLVELATTLGTLGSITDNGDGTYTAILTAGTTSGPATITGLVNGATMADDATVTLSASAASATTSTITASPTSIPGDGSSTSAVTVQLKDASDLNLTTGGDAVTLATTLGVLSPVTDNADGTYTATLTAGTTSGTATITGTVNGADIADAATVTFSCSDAFEPNDSFATAAALTLGSAINGKICTYGDQDYFSFSATTGQDITVTLAPPAGKDLHVTLYQPSQASITDLHTGGTTRTTTRTATFTGTHFVKVYPSGSAYGANEYTLTVTVEDQLGVSPTSVSESAPEGTTATKTADLTLSGTNPLGWTATTTESSSWLSLSAASGTTPSTLTLTMDPSGLAVGIHRDTVVVTAPGAGGSPDSTPVTFTISCTDAFEPNNTFASATTLTAGAATNAKLCSTSDYDYFSISVVAGQTIKLSLTPPSGFSYNAGLYTPAQNSVGTLYTYGNPAETTHVAAFTGTYFVRVYRSSGSVSQTLQYTLTVDLLDQLTVTPSSVSESATEGATETKSADLTLSGSTPLGWTATTTQSKSWLSLSAASGTTPSTLTLTMNPTGLSIGTHRDTVVVTAPGAVGSPDSTPVTFTISCTDAFEPNDSFAEAAALTAGTPTNGKLCSTSDDDYFSISVVAGQTIKLSLTPPGAFLYNATLYTPSQSYVTTLYTYGNPAETTHVAAFTGSYFVRVYRSSGSVSQTLPYTLTVDLQDKLTVTPGSVSESAPEGTTTAKTADLTLSGTNPLGWTATTTQSNTWLSLSAASGTTPSTLTLTMDPSGMAAGIHRDTVVVAASGAVGSPDSTPVTFTITCSDAASEPNDTFGTATALTVGTATTGCISTSSDEDYFSFSATFGQNIAVTLTPPAGEDYHFSLYDPSQGAMIYSVHTGGSTETRSSTATSSGTHYVRVWGYGSYDYSATIPYTLTVTITP
jgi:adhesin/invasin